MSSSIAEMTRRAQAKADPEEPVLSEETREALARQVEVLRREVALLKAKLAEAEGLADADVLAPVLNRRAFVRELKRAIAAVKRYGEPASVLYFDLDGFKAVNDRHGHAAGDAALKAVAERLSASVRTSDVVARLGGDEFAVILTRADGPAARAKADLLAAALAAPVLFGGAEIRVEASCGVRELVGEDVPEAALAEADAAMFANKPGRR